MNILKGKRRGRDNIYNESLFSSLTELVPKVPGFTTLRMKGVYRKRYIVEQLISKAKNSMGDRDRTKDFHVASLYVLARFVLLSLALLEELLILWLKLWLFFQQAQCYLTDGRFVSIYILSRQEA